MSKKKILLIRLDKIGDLICTLPTDQILPLEEFEVFWVVQKGMGQVVELGEQQRTFIEIDKTNQKSATKILSDLLIKFQPDIAISFQCPWWVNFELFKARIPIRSGVLSQWHSYLFLNHAVRQKRSLALKHEYEYNLDLVLNLFDTNQKKIFEQQKINKILNIFKIKIPSNQDLLIKNNLSKNKYIVVHPGMMGSALNWPTEKYIEFIENQLNVNKCIVLTGTTSDEIFLTDIKNYFFNNPQFERFVKKNQLINLQSRLNLTDLVQVLYYSEHVVAPSTGVAHLAASVGAKLKSIYSPIKVHHPTRWSPRGPSVEIFLPQVQCPQQFKCLQNKCRFYNCMSQIDIEK